MTSDREQLQLALKQLRAQLQEVQSLDPEVAERLRSTVDQIDAALAGKPRPSAEESSLADRLSDAALDFEASHPTLSGTLGSVIDALSRMGI